MKKNILFTTGGTGGHIYPALSIAKKMQNNANVIFLGTKHRMEKDIIPQNNFEFIGLDIIPIKSIKGIFKLIVGIFKSIKIIRKNKIDAIVSFGNYISLPASIAGLILRKPIYIQEQNIDFGMANNLVRRWAKKIFLAFNKTKEKYSLSGENVLVTGNPLREEFYINDVEEENAVLVTGGSLGAQNINEKFIQYIDKFLSNGIKIYFATGKNNYDSILSSIDKDLLSNENLVIQPYFENMSEIMKKSKLLICRAGAITISEIIELNKPAIFIPYNFVGQNENADLLVEYGYFKYSNDELGKAFEKALELIQNDEEIQKIKENVKKINFGNATEIISNEILGDLNGN